MTNTYGSLENRTDNHHLLVQKILSTEEFLTKNMKQCINHTTTTPQLKNAKQTNKKPHQKQIHGWSAQKPHKLLLERLKSTF